MTTIRTSNNSFMLAWAREEVGYTLEQAAEAIGISVDKLKVAESGNHQLTLNQLRTAAEQYGCPFGYFYLSKQPYKKSFKPLPDFRIEPDYIGVDHYRLHLEIKKVRDRRSVYLELAKSINSPIDVFHRITESSLTNNANTVRKRLNVDDSDSEVYFLKYDQAYAYWKSKIENDGVLVYESQYLPASTGVIGAAIYYDVCPIILIKRGTDYNYRKLFTLLHEYAHLLKGQSAINDASALTVGVANTESSNLEVQCNRLAAEILVPSGKVNLPDFSNLTPTDKMEKLANAFKVTFSTAAICLHRLNLVNQSELTYLLDLRRKEHKRKQSSASKEVKIPRENVMRLDLGRPMFRLVLEAYSNRMLNIFDASKILNLRVNKIDKLVSGAH